MRAFVIVTCVLGLLGIGRSQPQVVAQAPSAEPAEPESSPTEAPSTTPPAAEKPGSTQSPLRVIREETDGGEYDGALPNSGKIHRYAQKVLARYDEDQDGRLDSAEWRRMRGTPELADVNGDSIVTEEELALRIMSYGLRRSLRLKPLNRARLPAAVAAATNPMGDAQAETLPEDPALAEAARQRLSRRYHVPQTRLPGGLPPWFLDNDADGDGQITMTEFSPSLTEVEAAEFAAFDTNGDGVITPSEYAGAASRGRQAESASPPGEAPMQVVPAGPMPTPMATP